MGGGTDSGAATVGTSSNVVARLCLGGCWMQAVEWTFDS